MSQISSYPLRPSACPALSRIVAARDGGLCRIKLPGGELRAEQALAIADALDGHTSGVIELTNRANLQLRGVRAGHEAELTERLLGAGLGPQVPSVEAATAASMSDDPDSKLASAAADDVRNLMLSSPIAGRDVHALYDTRPLAARILALLQGEPRFTQLSPKFAVLLDGGERLAMIDHPHDIWLAAMAPSGGEPWFAFGLAGHPSTESGCALAAVEPANVPGLVRALLDTFLDLAGASDTRMRHLLLAQGVETILAAVSARVNFPLRRDSLVDAWRRADAQPSLRFGAHRQRAADLWHVGGQPPLGRIDAPALRALAQLALARGNATLTVTPWQGVLLTDVSEPSVCHVEKAFDTLGFVRDTTHPFARTIACAGSAGCARGCADTKADALKLAECLPAGVEVHLSGCIRSCAAAHCAPYTLLAVEPGRYDLYRRNAFDDQKPAPGHAPASDDRTAATQRFGQRIAAHLTPEEAAQRLGEAARSPFHG
ncbi:MAG TPA: precorrin-3B synthase [Trinickia sp.]|uniref:precorrin-3B synthase n=1 Tax=Trinickia sp. TaxID=2571163 RepID=UPI002BEDF0AC|nr:precorrin-3B synthase [Trinickia sp.]HTI17171.1 precorrin-3B synthase [Trinickia sp.]